MNAATSLLEKELELRYPPVGLYDAPEPGVFAPCIEPSGPGHLCIFKYFDNWKNGETLHLTEEKHGCGGCANALFDHQIKSRDEFLDFLVDGEGLKVSKALMNEWVESMQNYKPEHGHVFIGPIKLEQRQYLKTVTYFINPDQLSLLVYGVNYHAGPNDPPSLTAPFGAGCMQMISVFSDLDAAQAAIGGTDLAMRAFIPADILAFTMTVPMYERLNTLDESSFLGKPFLKNLKRKRPIA